MGCRTRFFPLVAKEFRDMMNGFAVEPKSHNDLLSETNAILRDSVEGGGYVYIDLAAHMRAADGTLKASLTYDGLHLIDKGYAVWAKALGHCVRHGCRELPSAQ